MSSYYDRQGQPIDMMTWAQMFEDKAVKVVAQTKVGDVLVSTAWLGLDHNFLGGPPLIFETMVFGGLLDQEQERYSTEAQALAGHDQMVAKVKALVSDGDEPG
jgi:hypothetical protein